ncbi:MAG: YkgJ family cysteine cluster protein [Deltaproteobacteria bacterium]|nr:YkgJ family cysteine cluster protein [Deltaproteobacteria bacterium]
MSSSDPDAPECLSCGACCFADLPRYVRVTGDDHARLGDDADALTVWYGNQAFLGMNDGHCAALEVDGAVGHFACRVYDRRPAICRELERGSPACRGERDLKAERAMVALRLHRGS